MKQRVRAVVVPALLTCCLALWAPAQVRAETETEGGPVTPAQAEKRAGIMAMDLREMVREDDARIRNISNELAALGAPVVPTLFDLLSDPVPTVRRAAAMALGQLQPPEALASLVAALGDEDVSVTVAAIGALAHYDDPWAVRALVRWLAHPSPLVQASIIEVLGQRPKAAIHNVIRHQLKSPPAGVGPGPFVAALGRFPDSKTQRELIAALDDPALAPYGVRGLAFFGPKAARDMGKWLSRNAVAHPSVATDVAGVMVGFGGAGDKEIGKVLGKMPIDLQRAIMRGLVAADPDAGARRVTALARHSSIDSRVVALEMMPSIPGADPRPSLKDNLRHRDARVPVLAAHAVVGPQRDTILERLLITRYRELARHRRAENAPARQAILRALGRIGADESVAELVQAIGHDDEVAPALEGLGMLGERAIGPLLFVIKTGDPVRTPLAVQALATAGPHAVAPLVRLLLHRSRDVRNVARRALAEIGTTDIVGDLVELIKDEQTAGREQLLVLLGALYGDEAYAALKMFARSNSEHGIRLAAVRVLSQQDDPRVLPVLRTVAEKDVHNAVRNLAVKALLWQDDVEAVPLLVKMIEYEKDFIRTTCAQALGYLGSPADVMLLVPRLSTPRDQVKTAVRNALRRITFRPRLVKAEQFEDWADEHAERVERFAPVKAGEMTLADGTVMHYWLGGRGRPLLMLPGGPDLSHRYLRPATDRLMDSRLLVYVDLPGRGESTAPTEEGVSLGIEHDVASVATMLARLNFRQIDVYGHGWGAMVAARLADKHPKLVSRLVLDNTPKPTLAGWVAMQDVAVQRIPEPWSLDLEELHADRSRWRPDVLHRTTMVAILTGSMAHPAPLLNLHRKLDGRAAVAGAILAPMGAFDLTALYARLSKPTLLIHGHSSPLDADTRAWRDALAEANDSVSVVDLEASGFVPFYENGPAWEDAISGFLK